MSPLKTKRSDSIETDHNLNYEGILEIYLTILLLHDYLKLFLIFLLKYLLSLFDIILGNCDSVPNLASPSNLRFPARLKLRRASVSLDGATCAGLDGIGSNGPMSRYKHRSTFRQSMGRQGSIQVNIILLSYTYFYGKPHSY